MYVDRIGELHNRVGKCRNEFMSLLIFRVDITVIMLKVYFITSVEHLIYKFLILPFKRHHHKNNIA